VVVEVVKEALKEEGRSVQLVRDRVWAFLKERLGPRLSISSLG